MTTSIAIEKRLLETAFKVSGLKTKKELVKRALEEYLQHHKQEEILKYFNKIDFDEDFDYKKMRKR